MTSKGMIGDTLGYKIALMIALTLALSGTFIDYLPRFGIVLRKPIANISLDQPFTLQSLTWVPEGCPDNITGKPKKIRMTKNQSFVSAKLLHRSIG